MSGPIVPPSLAVAVSQPPPLKIPDSFNEASLAAELAKRLTGRPTGANPVIATRNIAGQVIWVDAGSEVMLHLDSAKTHITDGMLLVSVDFDCDQTGRTPLVAAFAMNHATDGAGLFCATDELPRGNGLLAARWGKIYQDAIWAALTSLVSDHAAERKLSPLALICANATLTLRSGAALAASQFVAPAGNPVPALNLDVKPEVKS